MEGCLPNTIPLGAWIPGYMGELGCTPLGTSDGCPSPEGVNAGGEGSCSIAAGGVAALVTVDGLVSATLLSPLFVAVFNNGFDTAERPDCTVDLRASVGRVVKLPRSPIIP